MGFLGNHEVPIIIEDGSIRLVAYRSHFDVNILNRIAPLPNTKVIAPTTQSTGTRVGHGIPITATMCCRWQWR